MTAVESSADLWVEVQVEGLSLGRTRLGAVPYAIEAGHSLRADQAARATGSLAGMWSASPTDACATITGTPTWTDIPGNVITFQVDAPARVLGTFSLNAQPSSSPGSEFVAVRMVLDGNGVPGGADYYQPFSSADSNAALHAIVVGDVAAGSHTVKLQWLTNNGSDTGGGTVAWVSCPWENGTRGAIGARTLVVQAFYK